MMNRKLNMTYRLSLVTALSLLLAVPTWAQAPKSLDKCQKAAAKLSAGFLAARNKAIQKCLQKISGELIKGNEPNVSGAAKTCAASFRKLVNSDAPAKQLADKAKGKIRKACDPSVNAKLTHTTDQVLSLTPIGVSEGIEAKRVEGYCFSFGGDSSFDSVEEWVDCQLAGGTCESNQNISVQYPRALEWLAAVKTQIQGLGMAQKYLDAVAAIDAMRLALDSDSNMTLDINCGPGDSLCGNGSIDANEQCDGVNLNSQTCVSVGFPDGGTLACQGNCGFNYQGCVSGTFSQTGQATPFPDLDNDDGEVKAGPPFSYVDNGDGTITDQNSGFMWEKLSDDASIHKGTTSYTWANGFAKITTLNTMPCFAGHCDWRMPNRHELASILHMGKHNPSTHDVFNSGCVPNCTVTTCSCTPSIGFWTSTTRNSGGGTNAWFFVFDDGSSSVSSKSSTLAVRAVRGP